MSTIEELRKSVEQLYEYRNKYYSLSPIEKYSLKESNVNAKLQVTLELLQSAKEECEKKEKAVYCMLYGKALNVKREYDQLAFDYLSKAVKLNPKLTEAWNELGECYWKKGDLKASLNCFEGCLKYDKTDKVALRNLSMLLRQLGDTAIEKQNNLLKSVEIAKEAVSADLTDGMSWYILGNAYFKLFFATANKEMMKQCKAAYSKAKFDATTTSQPDFLFNFAVCLQYEEMFQESLEYFAKASLLDPCWSEPSDVRLSLLHFIRDICEMITKKASLKAKRIQNMLTTIKPEMQCGPLKDLEKINISEMTIGDNRNRVLLCKIIGSVNTEKMLCHTFCVMDSNQMCAALSVYNLNSEKGPKIGDSLAVADPYFRTIEVNHENLKKSYGTIRVDNPTKLVVNGKQMMPDCVAIPKITFTVTSG